MSGLEVLSCRLLQLLLMVDVEQALELVLVEVIPQDRLAGSNAGELFHDAGDAEEIGGVVEQLVVAVFLPLE